jgi:hypothetical protein
VRSELFRIIESFATLITCENLMDTVRLLKVIIKRLTSIELHAANTASVFLLFGQVCSQMLFDMVRSGKPSSADVAGVGPFPAVDAYVPLKFGGSGVGLATHVTGVVRDPTGLVVARYMLLHVFGRLKLPRTIATHVFGDHF